ncbi:MAG TPA: hypothetical protein VJC05_02655 [Candidatus Andersenbacteria bacterium]|nr:hypothetical protein [Candidatus Andersenbacteria bacterium]
MNKSVFILIILFLAGLALALSPWNPFFSRSISDRCFTVYQPTYVPAGQTVQAIDALDLSRPCPERAARFAPDPDNKPWEIEERTVDTGLATYQFNLEHLTFTESADRKYTFVQDRNSQPALLGFIDDTFVYITNAKSGPLTKDDMAKIFAGLRQ